jgi:precorrin-2 dehydrogenase/sirohydrochlorin ferrochelatase
MTTPLFPVFLKLNGRRCLVVGGGAIAAQKLPGLIEAGADVTIVAPKLSAGVLRLVKPGQARWIEREFESDDIDGALLVVAATGDPDVNECIFRAATSRGILCNAVDEPERCDFYYPAVVRRGDLQIAISTNGKSPALAQRLRAELEAHFDAAYGEWLAWLGSVRELFFRTRIEPEKRRRALHQVASRAVYERFRASRQRKNAEARHG